MTKALPPKSLVLYADDDVDDIALVQEAFEAFSDGIELRTFPTGIALLEFLDGLSPFQPRPCLIILDINMPRMSGKDSLQKLRSRKEFEAVPVVLFSTSTLPAEAQFAQKWNAGFVTKPLLSSQIAQIVEQLLAHCSEEVRKKFRRP